MPKPQITKKRLAEDGQINKKMDILKLEGKENTREYKDLFRKYYIDNDDIRVHWATF